MQKVRDVKMFVNFSVKNNRIFKSGINPSPAEFLKWNNPPSIFETVPFSY